MNSESFDSRIQKMIFSLSDTEEEIVQYLRKNRSSLGTIREVANELYVVPNTLFRLSKKLGYDGWSEMRYAIQDSSSGSQVHSGLLPTSSRTLANIKKTVDSLNLLKKIDSSDTTVIYGIGDNKYFCELLIKYLRIGDPSKHILYDSDFTIKGLTERDTAIFLSYSGQTAMTEQMALLARENKAFVVSITGPDTEINSVKAVADLCFVYYNDDPLVEDRLAPDFTGLMFIIREIATTYWRSKLS